MDATITTWVIIGCALLWLFWDIYLYVYKKETISVKIRRWSEHVLPIVFIAGFLCGHWFW